LAVQLLEFVLVIGMGEDVCPVLAHPLEDPRADHIGLHAVFMDSGEPLDRIAIDRLGPGPTLVGPDIVAGVDDALDQAGVHHRDADAVAIHRMAQRIAEAAHGELRGVVDSRRPAGDEARHAGGVGDVPALLLACLYAGLHPRGEGHYAVDYT